MPWASPIPGRSVSGLLPVRQVVGGVVYISASCPEPGVAGHQVGERIQRPVELDALVTSVTELGRAVGVRTPSVDTLLGLARLNAQVRGLYPAG